MVIPVPPFGNIHAPTHFYFIRHGQSVANQTSRIQGRSESPLSEQGRHQAQQTAKWFTGQEPIQESIKKPIGPIYTSPLGRAQSTAQSIAQQVGCTLYVDDLLIELDTGIFSNLSAAEAEKAYPKEWLAFQHHSWEAVPMAETIHSLVDRASRYWHTLIERANAHNYHAILSVTHGGMLQWILKVALGAQAQWMPLIPASNCGIFHLYVRPAPPSEAGTRGYYAAWKHMNTVVYTPG